ncbi:hypothetical protein H2203_005288 [Taxawa tesnikishii (nom. ined.)]|nr:hypothetical protein H2203_005288 [Dothideales sp. JES 119]
MVNVAYAALAVTLPLYSGIAAALTVALPLYQWPSSGAWTSVYKVIASNPNTTFDVIINPNSGPGSFPPDSEYIAAVAAINKHTNVNTYGYLHTSWAGRALSSVETDVKTYVKWNSYKGANIALDGIFVDEATADTSDLPYMKSLYSYIRNNMPKNHGKVWTNPGCAVDAKFYSYADMVTAFEDTYTAWKSYGSTAIKASLKSKSSVMILNYSGDSNGVASQAKGLISQGYQGGLLYGNGGYQNYSKVWGTFAGYVQVYR